MYVSICFEFDKFLVWFFLGTSFAYVKKKKKEEKRRKEKVMSSTSNVYMN